MYLCRWGSGLAGGPVGLMVPICLNEIQIMTQAAARLHIQADADTYAKLRPPLG